MTSCGAAAVAEPAIATVGFVSSNSATPAASPTAPGSVRFAVTSTGVADAVGQDRSRVHAGLGDHAVAAKADDRRDAGPVVVGRDQAGVGPALGERRRGCGDDAAGRCGEVRGACPGKPWGGMTRPPGTVTRVSDRIDAAGGIVVRDGRVLLVAPASLRRLDLPEGRSSTPASRSRTPRSARSRRRPGCAAASAASCASTRYEVGGRPKLVRYWLMTPESRDRVRAERRDGRPALARARGREGPPHLRARPRAAQDRGRRQRRDSDGPR